jgi:hypothetical protein
MGALSPSPDERQPTLVGRPQRLGIVPILAFWNRRDVRRTTGPWMAGFAFLWLILLEVLRSAVPGWTLALMAGTGPLLFLGILERYLRGRLRRRALDQRSEAAGADAHGGQAHLAREPDETR